MGCKEFLLTVKGTRVPGKHRVPPGKSVVACGELSHSNSHCHRLSCGCCAAPGRRTAPAP
eukprot:3881566-Rhodomonas_salina.2